ncbi:DUF1345 domain-containing protein [Floridanema evergladense]|uniref:DUF1345 domain-containing protein n=1 Tax=Floridaenema evergladense BLCC-F167 TaxID=3153639 RepID=A0ABV4WUS0_9CYAN
MKTFPTRKSGYSAIRQLLRQLNQVLKLILINSLDLGKRSLSNLNAEGRLAFSVKVAMVLFLILPNFVELDNRILISWIGGVLCFLALILLVIGIKTPQQTCDYVQYQEQNADRLFLPITIAACVSLFAIAFMQSNSQEISSSTITFQVILSLTAIVCSWFLTHTMFALHYASCYYQQDFSSPTGYAGGLLFPGEEMPNYWDFMYFAFVMGMTFQSADVLISSSSMRMLALAHGGVGFLFSMVILASSVNVASGLI